VYEAVKTQDIFHTLLKHAKAKRYVEGILTLTFDSVHKQKHFEKFYQSRFEMLASKLFGKEIKVELEGAK